MKKVKIMLTAIAIIAVVGGALAFKAKKFQVTPLLCGTTTTSCTTEIFTSTSTTTTPFIQDVYCTYIDGNTTTCNLSVTTTVPE